MPKFLMLGKYTVEGIKEISGDRTTKVENIVKMAGGKIEAKHALLGNYDIAVLADFPGNPEALKASVAITGLTGITFTTSPAITVEEFDKLTG